MIATVDNLDAITIFDIAFEVSENHDVSTRMDVYTPAILDGEIDSDNWEFFSDGYTGQYGYSGPIMHDSEYIGGMLAEDILNEPGIYVVVAAMYSPKNDNDEFVWEGWAVLRYVGKD